METEITVQVFNTESEIEKILSGQGFEIVEKFQINDHYFSKHSLAKIKKMSYKTLIKNSFLVRVVESRYIVNQDKLDESSSVLCYKNKMINKNEVVIGEEKIKSSVLDFQKAIDIFLRAGLTRWCICNNFNIEYKKGNFSLLLQKIEGLGIFIECEENATIAHLPAEEKRNQLIKQVKEIGLDLGTDFSCKKSFMLLHL